MRSNEARLWHARPATHFRALHTHISSSGDDPGLYGHLLFELRLMHAAFLVLHARYLNAIGRNVGAGVPSVS